MYSVLNDCTFMEYGNLIEPSVDIGFGNRVEGSVSSSRIMNVASL